MNKKIPLMIQIVHWLKYFPIAIVYFVFEVAKAILTELEKVAIAILVMMLILETVIMSRIFMNPFNFIRMAFSNELWSMFMNDFFGVNSGTVAESIMLRIFLVSFYLFLFIGIPLLISSIVYFASKELNERAEWDDIEGKFGDVFKTLSTRTENDFHHDRSGFYKKSIFSVVLNIALIVFLIMLGGFASKGTKALRDQNNDRIAAVETSVEKGSDSTSEESIDAQDYIYVDASAANIRSGPGTDHDSIKLVSKGESFRMTGRTEPTKSGHLWYEIYLSEEMEETGWISDSVIVK